MICDVLSKLKLFFLFDAIWIVTQQLIPFFANVFILKFIKKGSTLKIKETKWFKWMFQIYNVIFIAIFLSWLLTKVVPCIINIGINLENIISSLCFSIYYEERIIHQNNWRKFERRIKHS